VDSVFKATALHFVQHCYSITITIQLVESIAHHFKWYTSSFNIFGITNFKLKCRTDVC
jgi:hypothetical protein